MVKQEKHRYGNFWTSLTSHCIFRFKTETFLHGHTRKFCSKFNIFLRVILKKRCKIIWVMMFCLTETNSNFFQVSFMGCWGFNWTPPILHLEQVLNVIIRQAVAWVEPGRKQICRAGSQVLLWVSLSSLSSPPASLSSLAKMISSWQLFMSVTSLGQTLINWPSVKGRHSFQHLSIASFDSFRPEPASL